MTETCYDCDICLGVNHIARFHCQYCGTIPARYSMLAAPAKLTANGSLVDDLGMPMYINVLVAFGAMRQTSHRTVKRILRTVKADYYASE